MTKVHVTRGHDEHGRPGVEVEIEPDSLWAGLRQVKAIRFFWFEWLLLLAYVAMQVFFAIVLAGERTFIDTLISTVSSLIITAFLLAAILKSAAAHRRGYIRGLSAAMLASRAAQRRPQRIPQIVAGSLELWDPEPEETVHRLEIEDLERHANEGG